MGQYWQLINFDRKETSEHLGKMGEFFPQSQEGLASVVRRLYIPASLRDASPSKLTTSTGELVLGLLATIPPEMIGLIFEQVDNFADAICLGLAHQHLLSIGMKRVETLHAQEVAPWIGSRIICAGDYANDTPKGMLTPSEEKELKLKRHNIYHWASNAFKETRLSTYLKRRAALFGRLDKKAVNEMLGKVPLAKPWMLCNLTKFECVRAEAFAKIPYVDLGHVLLSLICWSSQYDNTMSDPPSIRGKWAGDRFEITTRDRMLRLRDEAGWKDVSLPIAKRVAEIMRE
ncbi:hypothetical protein FA95DRAFT_1679079 [Auriscalpium vulgare]|uniref:Uncharacterized protein n=1 Tax=Auriscalpium vulgare TaxID=40419 RepID=A0ACB8RT72_9AGAM|nr:hypothetical protein FA95DRAFT_1679079 [Auriscalpium vulgare]